MAIKRSDRDRLTYGQMVKITNEKESSWIAKMCDLFIELSYPQKQALLTHFIELEIGPKSWETYFKDESKWVNCWGNIVYYYTGREDIKSEPDQTQLVEQLKDFFASGLYADAKIEADDDKNKVEFEDLMEDLNE